MAADFDPKNWRLTNASTGKVWEDRDDMLADLFPSARTTDPDTSHEAARAVRPGGEDLQKAIRAAIYDNYDQPLSAETIAAWIIDYWEPVRWLPSTIVSACNPKRSGLVVVGHTTNSRGRRVQLLALP